MPKPLVALVGRPNVGKSTLFNRLVGRRLAIVDDVPGTTRDRIYAECTWNGRVFGIVDTGGIDPTHGGKSILSIGSADFIEEIKSQATTAIEEADAILFLVDGESGVTPADREVAETLRRHQTRRGDGTPHPPILLVVNKCDTAKRRAAAVEFYELGLGEPQTISAVHGTDVGDLLDSLVGNIPDSEAQEDESIKIAIAGKPNSGKSSLLNRLVGKERSIVSPVAGTTRDAVDTVIDLAGMPVTLIDTAGIRRRGKVERGVEQFSVLRSFMAIERADVVLLLIDAVTGISAQDAHIAGFVVEASKSCVLLVNKWDLVEKDPGTKEAYTQRIRLDLKFIDYAPLLFISATTGAGVDQVLPMALRVQEERLVRLSTSKINRILVEAQDRQAPPARAGRQLKLFYGTQVRSDPPTFMIYMNDPALLHFSYRRFLENRLREEYGFLGTPIRIVAKGRREK
ncbi:MAG: ribosome biogenesis GTPase Der [Chloroflexota bacterium]